jgi:hypothetical protein
MPDITIYNIVLPSKIYILTLPVFQYVLRFFLKNSLTKSILMRYNSKIKYYLLCRKTLPMPTRFGGYLAATHHIEDNYIPHYIEWVSW